MNKTVTVGAAVLILAVIGYFVVNRVVSNKASEEVERLAAPKLKELGVSYSDMSVNAGGGSLTMRNVQFEEAYAEEVTVRASHKDLLALMNGNTMFLNGIEVDLTNMRASDKRGREGVEIGSAKADIDALLDLAKLQRDPDLFFEDLRTQEEVHIELEGRDWVIRSEEIEDELELPMTSLRLSEWSLEIDKDGDQYHANAMASESQLGRIEMETKGSEQILTYFRGSLSDIDVTTDDVTVRLGKADVEMNAPIPLSDLGDRSDEWLLDLMKQGQSFDWSISASDFELASPDMVAAVREFGLSEGQITMSSFKHDASYSNDSFKASFNLRSNAGDGKANVDMRVDNPAQMEDPESVHFNDLSIELTNLMPIAADQLRAFPSPLEPKGANGFEFSYQGPATGLAELDL